ncbi:SURF1 family protein [Dermatophilus congolensis]|uniref:SURF1 family cytochrome oxidase biogenesis protein n=1 Tax=Dermatophilus congolensis TaxID=1863 RepID=UPI00312CB5B4
MGRAVVMRWLTPRWLGATAVALAFFVLCQFLGQWQWGRYEGKLANRERVESFYSAPVRPLSEVVPAQTARPGGAVGKEQEWRHVQMRGEYVSGARFMVRNRPQDRSYGYEVLVPLRLEDGTAVMVDRGWVANGERADVLPAVPSPPSGQVSVSGWVRPGEPPFNENTPAGQLGSIDVERMRRESGLLLRGAYVVLEREQDGSGASPARPEPLLPPQTGLGPHFAYALQWWVGSLVGFVIVFVYVRREVRDELILSGQLTPKAPKPKKTRIWDEEDA